jgi:putative membrane protein
MRGIRILGTHKSRTSRPGKIFLCPATVLLAVAAALAQSPGSAPQQPMQSQPSSPAMGTPGVNPGMAPSSQNFGDQSFLAQALAGGDAEIQLGQLAQQKSQSDDVKQFAQKMVSDHSQMDDKWLNPVAKQLGVSEPKGPDKKDKKLIAKLQTLSGSEFDTEYIQAMFKGHKQDLKEFNEEAQATQDPNVKQLAQQGATVIREHLQLIEQVAKNHNVDVEGKEVSSTH